MSLAAASWPFTVRAQHGDGVMREAFGEQRFLLASLPPSRGQIRLAFGIAVALLVVFSITAPFAEIQLPRIDSFVPAHQSVYAVNDLITSALLFAQFSIVRRWALLVLAIGFLYSALIAIPLMFVFFREHSLRQGFSALDCKLRHGFIISGSSDYH